MYILTYNNVQPRMPLSCYVYFSSGMKIASLSNSLLSTIHEENTGIMQVPYWQKNSEEAVPVHNLYIVVCTSLLVLSLVNDFCLYKDTERN
jgi:hypothetical protein